MPNPFASRFAGRLELKFLNENGMFEGYASVFHVTDNVNDRVAPGAFAASLEESQAEGRALPMLWQHNPEEPIGVWREIKEDEHGLYVKGELFVNDIPRAREAYKLMREKVVTGLSIDYRTKHAHHDRGARVLTDVDLVEISMVTFPANDFARVRRVKSVLDAGLVPSVTEFEAFLRDAGLSRKQAKGIIAEGYKSLGPKSLSLRDAAQGEDEEDLCEAILALSQVIRDATPT